PVVPLAAALMRRPAHLAHGARDVGRHRLLVHLAALSLLAARAGARSVGAHAAARTTIITTGDAAAASRARRRRCDGARRERKAAGHGPRSLSAGHHRARTR